MSNEGFDPSSYTEWDKNKMETGIELLAKHNRALDSKLDTLRTDIGSGFQRWESAARNAYDSCQKKWDNKQVKLNENINLMRSTLTTISGNYVSTERRIAGNWEDSRANRAV